MPESEQTPHAEQHRHNLTPQAKHERKQRVLTHNQPSIVQSIADAVVIKDGDVFFLATPSGDVPLSGSHGFGLYYHDCRYLHGYELRLAGGTGNPLISDAGSGYQAVFELTNPDIRMRGGGLIPKENLGLTWRRTIDGKALTLHDVITIQNFGLERAEFPLSLTFQAGFEDIFNVRGMLEEETGTPEKPSWQDSTLVFVYHGADKRWRSLAVHCSPGPVRIDGTAAHFHVAVDPGSSTELRLRLVIAEGDQRSAVLPRADGGDHAEQVRQRAERSTDAWLADFTRVESDSLLLNQIMQRSLRDLRLLETTLEQRTFFAAGVPWFVTLFGRDSIIAALETLAFEPRIAAQTLRVLASYQGREVNDWKDEQPGKILHELRVGELARMGAVPYTPYYGTIDATPLFLILAGRHATWTGDLALFHELRDSIEAALALQEHYGDSDGDGYIDYQSISGRGLINQGWKDSGDAIVNADGSLARPPIALVEVQGYAYQAQHTMADLYDRIGEHDRAQQLRQAADDLRQRFNRDFWLDDHGFYALALQAGQAPAAVRSSNPGHALWSSIADADKAKRTVEMLMADDMFSGWGVRTLSTTTRRFNPIGYHLGTVWPHDNAIIAAGCRRYGFDGPARRICTSMLEAAMYFQHARLPELFAGFGRQEYTVPVHYPVACHPQAWAAGCVPYLLETALGLQPDGFARQLHIHRPFLPDFVDRLDLRGLRVGQATVDLRFERTPDGPVATSVLKAKGELDVVVHQEPLSHQQKQEHPERGG